MAAWAGARKNAASAATTGAASEVLPHASVHAAATVNAMEEAGCRRPHTSHHAQSRANERMATGSTESRGVLFRMSMSQPPAVRADPICGASAAPAPMPIAVSACTSGSAIPKSPRSVQDVTATAAPLIAPSA